MRLFRSNVVMRGILRRVTLARAAAVSLQRFKSRQLRLPTPHLAGCLYHFCSWFRFA